MAIAASAPTSFPSIFQQISGKPQKRSGMLPPIFISTNPSHVNPLHLSHLFRSANFSCHRFPNMHPDGHVEPVDPDKLRLALSHSSVLVSVFCKPKFLTAQKQPVVSTFQEFLMGVAPVTELNGELVGFGRAVSDNGLTASIHDVVVLPSLQGRGIGRMIVRRIIRVLTGRGIYDVSALCSDAERSFFEACGFRSDILGSTTMMYTRGPLNQSAQCHDDGQMVKHAGRLLLSIPPITMCMKREDHRC